MSPTLSTQDNTSTNKLDSKLRSITISTDNKAISLQNVSQNSPKSSAHSSNKFKCADMERYNCQVGGESTQELLGSVTTFTPSNDHETGHALRTSARVIHKMRMDSIRPPTPPPEKKDLTKDDRQLPKTPNQTRAHRSVWSNNEKTLFFEALSEYGRDFESIVTLINNRMRRKTQNDVDYKTKDSVVRFYNQIFQKLSKYLQFSDEISKIAKELYALINYGEMRKKLAFINDKCYLKLSDLVYKGSVTIREKGKNIKIKTPSCRALRKLNELEEWQEEIKLPPRVDVVLRPGNIVAWGKVQTLAQNPRIKISLPLQKRVAGLLQTLQHKWRHRNIRLNEKLMKLQPITTASHNSKIRHKHDTEFFAQLALNNPQNNDQQLLSFSPPKDTVIHRPMVNLSEFLSSYKICLNSYEERIGVVRRGESLCAEKVTRIKEMLKSNSKRQRHDSGNEKSSCLDKKSPDHPSHSKRLKSDEVKNHDNETAVSSDREFVDKLKSEDVDGLAGVHALHDSSDNVLATKIKVAPDSTDSESEQQQQQQPVKSNVEDFLIFKLLNTAVVGGAESDNANKADEEPPAINENNNKNICDTSTINLINNNKPTLLASDLVVKCATKRKDTKLSRKNKEFKPLVNEETIQKIREGWTMENVGDLTVGDLYVMFGKDLKLTLEYRWKDEKPVPTSCPTNSTDVPTVVEEVKHVPAKNKNKKTSEKVRLMNMRRSTDSVGSKLKQLLMIASLNEKFKRKTSCICSHQAEKRRKAEADMNAELSDGIFKQPAVPVRNSSSYYHETYRLNVNNIKYKQNAKWFNNRSPRKPLGLKILPLIKTVPPPTEKKQQLASITTTSCSSPSTSSAQQPVGDDKNEIVDNTTCFYAKAMECEKTEEIAGNKSGSNDSFVTDILEERIYKLRDQMTTKAGGSKNVVDDFDDASIKRLLYDSSSNLSYPAMYDLSYPSTAAMSPMRILRESPVDGRPLVGMHDVSLNSFLGHLDAACDGGLKTISRNCAQERMSSNLSVISETSVDFIAKFEDIAAELRASENIS